MASKKITAREDSRRDFLQLIQIQTESSQTVFHKPVHFRHIQRLQRLQRLLEMLPPALRASYEHLVLEDDAEVTPIVKAADKLSAYIKCVEEQKAGNTEFDSAEAATMQSMLAMDRPELNWFIENCLEPFRLNLDQL